MARASARALRSDGHSVGAISAKYSQMASDSQTSVSPSIRHGTLADGEYLRISVLVVACRSRTDISSNGKPTCFSVSHGRRLHDE